MGKTNLNLSKGSYSFGFSSASDVEPASSHRLMTPQMCQIARVMQKVAFVGLVALGMATALGFASATTLILGAVAFIGISAFYYASQYINYKQICKTAGIVFQNAEQIKKFEVSGIKGICEALPTAHCADTDLWREDLIKAAEHNIILSGNYCGGKSFKHFLDLIEQQIKQKPNLKVVIISSPIFIKNGNIDKIQQLHKLYPHNFSLVESPDIWHISPSLKKSTNHTKGLVIDYGKYFILGGSGIKDNWTDTGIDHLSKEEFIKQKDVQSNNGDIENPPVQAIKEQITEDPNAEDGFFGKLVSSNFRDMDFVFKSQKGKNSTGKQVYKQMLLLSHRWEEYNKMVKTGPNPSQLNANDLGVFTDQTSEINSQDSLITQMLKTPIPRWSQIKTSVPTFDHSLKKSADVSFQVFASGPEQQSSRFAQKLEKRIKKAHNQIVINHMYFHPTSSIMKALIEAAERGVKIKIITAGIYKSCPASHFIFAPRNKYNYAYLTRSVSKEKRANIEVYEFEQEKKATHKKAIVVDDYVIAGSSNLGYKSLVTTSDHELNFFAKSQTFADETLKICDIDIQCSKKIQDPTRLMISDYFQAAFHRLLAPLIG